MAERGRRITVVLEGSDAQGAVDQAKADEEFEIQKEMALKGESPFELGLSHGQSALLATERIERAYDSPTTLSDDALTIGRWNKGASNLKAKRGKCQIPHLYDCYTAAISYARIVAKARIKSMSSLNGLMEFQALCMMKYGQAIPEAARLLREELYIVTQSALGRNVG